MARKEKKYHYLYKTTNIINNKFYVGMHSTDKLNDGYVGSGKKLWYSLKKYGKQNFSLKILEFHPNRIALKQREKELINENLLIDPLCMNLKCGDEGGFISEEQQKYRSSCAGKAYGEKLKTDIKFKKRMSEIRSEKAKANYKLGVYKDKKFDLFKNKHHTDETKKTMSEAHIGKGIGKENSQYDTCWITNGILNKKIKKCDITKHVNSEWKLGRIT